MKYKKIYLEITNNCNLSCPFCIKNTRKIKYLTKDNFKIILEKLKEHTNYLYFHIMGEPLMHTDINYFIDYATKEGFKINITTNGYLIDKIKDNKNIRQLNVSLHSYNEKYNIPLIEYLDKIFKTIDTLDNTYISLRLWVKNKYTPEILSYLNTKYNLNIKEIKDNLKIKDRLYLSSFHEFIWPDLDNNYYNEKGTCYGTRDHIGILVDGTIIPCCLDSKGIINLGNIYYNTIEEINNNTRYKTIKEGFCNNKKTEELCKHCHFLE